MGYIIVGLDNSDASRKAFHQAVREAEWRNASVLAIHTVSVPTSAGYEYIDYMGDFLSGGQEQTEKELNELESHYKNGFPVEVKHQVSVGHAGVQIIEAAKGVDGGEPAELVVLGSRGLGGFKGLLLGSVSTYAAHHLTCPLLIIPAENEE
ncbi:MAG: nucleotide-binding universal stress UspA family protein [Acidimicrobiales bacterium]|jgi:nucleotide-binding universal stress UspA family protein